MTGEIDINKLQEELTQYKNKVHSDNNRILQILTAGKAIANQSVEHEFAGFKFKTLAYVPKSIREEFVSKMTTLEDDDTVSFDDVNKIYANFVASICVEDELKDPEVWIQFDEVSGALASVGQYLFKELTINDAEVKTFRKH